MTGQPAGGTVARFAADPAFPRRPRFAGLTPGNPEFSTCWKALASESPEAFFKAQHALIQRTHFDPPVRKIEAEDGLNVTLRSHARQDVIWSTAVPRRDVAMELPGEKPAPLLVDGLHHQARKCKERRSRRLQKQISVLAYNQLL
jgi:hypothetical protein